MLRFPIAPFAALFAFALLAIVLAAQTGLRFCSNSVAVPLPGSSMMTGMDADGMPAADMPHIGVLMICPVILILIVAATLLAGIAMIALARDRHRGASGRRFAIGLARLPFARTSVALMVSGGVAVASMLAADGNPPSGLSGWCALAAVLALTAIALTLLSLGAARCVVALSTRLAVIVAGVAARRRPVALARAWRVGVARTPLAGAPLLAASCGLRGPPLVDR